MTKIKNLLNLANKLGIDAKQIDDNSVEINKSIRGFRKLASKLQITVYISEADDSKPMLCPCCRTLLEMEFLSVIRHSDLGWVHQVCAWEYENNKE